MWKKFDNDMKRKAHMFEGIFIDPFNNDNPSVHPLNFASGVVTTSAIKKNLRKTLDKGSQVSKKLHEESFDTIRKQHATKKQLRLTSQV